MKDALDIALKLAKPFEGLSLVPYHDPVGYPTIGYGHLLSKTPWEDLSKWSSISQSEADRLLMKDMMSAVRQAGEASPVLLKYPNKWGAIADFVYNLGIGNYVSSTLKKKVDAELWDEAAVQIRRWIRARGVVLRGLVLRREAEAVLLLK